MTLGDFIKEYAAEHTMTEFIRDSGLSKAYVYMLVNNRNNNGEPIVPSIETIKKVAKGVHKSFDEVFCALDSDMMVSMRNREETIRQDISGELPQYSNISPVAKRSIPVLGKIACGEPILMDEQVELYVDAAGKFQCDYILWAKGDSMIGAGIHDGDAVFIRKQPTVENGEIAAVAIGDEATLKRFYFYPEKSMMILRAENPAFQDIIKTDEELADVIVLGRAMSVQTLLK